MTADEKIVFTTEFYNKNLDAFDKVQQKVDKLQKKYNQDLSEIRRQTINKMKQTSESQKKWFQTMEKNARIYSLQVRQQLDKQKAKADEYKNKLKEVQAESQRLASAQKATNKWMNSGAQKLVNVTSSAQEVANKFDSLSGSLSMTGDQFKFVNENGASFNTIGGRFGNRVRMMTHGLREFKMEMLGVMFFGMMMQRTLVGLLKPAAQLTGIFEIWNTILELMFLPTMIDLLPFFTDLLEKVAELNPETKKTIGKMVIFGIILATALMVIGQVTLGIGSMIMAFGSFLTIIPVVAGAIILLWSTFDILTKKDKDVIDWVNLIGNSFIGLGLMLLKYRPIIGAILIGIGMIFKINSKDISEYLELAVLSVKINMNSIKVALTKFNNWLLGWVKDNAYGKLVELFTGKDLSEEFKNNQQTIKSTLDEIESDSKRFAKILSSRGGKAFGIDFTQKEEDVSPFKRAIQQPMSIGGEFAGKSDMFSIGQGSTNAQKKLNELSTIWNEKGIEWDKKASEISNNENINLNSLNTQMNENINSIRENIDSNLETNVEDWNSWGEDVEERANNTAKNVESTLSNLKDDLKEIDELSGNKGGSEELTNVFSMGSSLSKFNDFVWRPGQKPISISPNDTLVGTKGGSDSGKSITINQTINATSSNQNEIKRIVDEAFSKLTMQIQRNT